MTQKKCGDGSATQESGSVSEPLGLEAIEVASTQAPLGSRACAVKE